MYYTFSVQKYINQTKVKDHTENAGERKSYGY